MLKFFIGLFPFLLLFQVQGSPISKETFNENLNKTIIKTESNEEYLNKSEETKKLKYTEKKFSESMQQFDSGVQTGLSYFAGYIMQYPVSMYFEFPATNRFNNFKPLVQIGTGLMYDFNKLKEGKDISSDYYYSAQTGVKFKIAQHKNFFRFLVLTGGVFYFWGKVGYSGNLMFEVVSSRITDTIFPRLNPKIGFQILYYDGNPYLGFGFHVGG